MGTVPEAQINDLGVFNRYKGGGNNLRGSADAAALLITHSDKWCGVGYMPPIAADQMTSYPFPKLMTSITVTKCAIGSYTFGHEVSHNFGNDHDQYDKTNKIPYAHGYHIRGRRWQDDNRCPSNNLLCTTGHFDHCSTCDH